MTVYSYAQLEGLWINAGGPRSLAPLMAAIAEAESGGDSNATGGVGEKGLWQINPNAWGSLATYDPAGNAKAAVHVYQVQGLGAWSTYTSGAYKRFLSGSTTPSTNVPSGGGSSSTGSGSGASSGGSGTSLATQAVTLTASSTRCLVGGSGVIPCLLDASQARGIIGGLCLLAGGLVFGVGVILVVAQSGAGAASAKAAASLTPVGRVASSVTGGKSVTKQLSADSGPQYRTGARAERKRSPAYESQPTSRSPRTRELADERGTSPEFRRRYGVKLSMRTCAVTWTGLSGALSRWTHTGRAG